MPESAESFAEYLERLVKERRLNSVSHEAWDLGTRGTAMATLRKVRERKRLPNPDLIAAFATLEEREAASFPEYPLATARRAIDAVRPLLDEHTYGMDTALAALASVAEPIKLLEAAGLPAPKDEIGRRVEGVAPSPAKPPRKGSRKAARARKRNER
jgi:hypothetical protein